MKNTILKGKDVIGLQIVTLEKGKILGNVNEIIFDPQNNQVKALLVDAGGWFTNARIILYEDVNKIGKDAVIVESENIIKNASEVQERITRILKGDNYLTTNKVVTEDGAEIGNVSDIFFDEPSGKVLELEVSQGTAENIKSGKKRVKVSDIIKVGEDVTIVRGYVEEDFEKQAEGHGLQGVSNTIGEKAPGLIDQAKQKLSDIGDDVEEKGKDLSDKTQSKLKEVQEDPETKEKLSEIRSKANSTKGTLEEKAIEIKDSINKKVQEGKKKVITQSKKDVVGKYLTTNILSKTDKVLAKRGDVITNELIAQAEENDMLDKLITNATVEPVTITNPSDTLTNTMESPKV